jgi:hypothetical protein
VAENRNTLFRLYGFWVALIIPLLFSAMLIYFIVEPRELHFQWDLIGFEYAWKIFHIPITVISLVIPLVALVASNHRSVQSRQQIDASLRQNILSVQPLLICQIDGNAEAAIKTFTVKNKGLGVAKLIGFDLYNNGQKDSLLGLEVYMHTNFPEVIFTTNIQLKANTYLTKEEGILGFELTSTREDNKLPDELYNYLYRFEVEMSYQCFYGEKYTTRDKIINLTI